MRLMQLKKIFSRSNLAVVGIILDIVNMKYVSKCWIVIVYVENYRFLVFIIRMDVTSDIANDQNFLLVIMM